jgi:hypothetical protein
MMIRPFHPKCREVGTGFSEKRRSTNKSICHLVALEGFFVCASSFLAFRKKLTTSIRAINIKNPTQILWFVLSVFRRADVSVDKMIIEVTISSRSLPRSSSNEEWH